MISRRITSHLPIKILPYHIYNCMRVYINSGTCPSILAFWTVSLEDTERGHVYRRRGSHPRVDVGPVNRLLRPVVAAHQSCRAVRVRHHKHGSHFIQTGVVKIRQYLLYRTGANDEPYCIGYENLSESAKPVRAINCIIFIYNISIFLRWVIVKWWNF